jgi:hypothetical protein
LIPSHGTKPMATSRALCLAMVLCLLRLTLKTHLSPIGQHSTDRSMSSHALLPLTPFISSMARR